MVLNCTPVNPDSRLFDTLLCSPTCPLLTLGLVMRVKVHKADIQDRSGATLLLDNLKTTFPRMNVVFADMGYSGKLANWMKEELGWKLEIIKHPWSGWQGTWVEVNSPAPAPIEVPAGFVVLKKRWIVERTFAWLGKSRRLAKDDEALVETAEAVVYEVMIRLMLRWLARV